LHFTFYTLSFIGYFPHARIKCEIFRIFIFAFYTCPSGSTDLKAATDAHTASRAGAESFPPNPPPTQ